MLLSCYRSIDLFLEASAALASSTLINTRKAVPGLHLFWFEAGRLGLKCSSLKLWKGKINKQQHALKTSLCVIFTIIGRSCGDEVQAELTAPLGERSLSFWTTGWGVFPALSSTFPFPCQTSSSPPEKVNKTRGRGDKEEKKRTGYFGAFLLITLILKPATRGRSNCICFCCICFTK